MGGKSATTTSKVSIPPEVLARYNAVNTRAETAASAPYEAFGKTASDYIAQMNAQQNAGISDINTTAGSYQPYMDKATSATQAGMGPAYEGIDNYMSPYIKNVADTTGAYMRQQQEQSQSGALGNAISSGAFGGDRAGIAAANLQQQNQMGYGKTMADILNQGYTQALGASQADLARQLQGGSQMAALGAQSQQLGLQGAQAKIAAGTMQQQTEQAGKDAMINQFMQEKGYPFQVAQFLANIAMGTGAASGSTTTTQTPRNWMGFASGGHVDGYANGGGVAGPRTYTQSGVGGEGYVPAGDLPVGQLMVANPPDQQQSNGTDEIIKIISMMSGGKKNGGAVENRHGYALDGSVLDQFGNRVTLNERVNPFLTEPDKRDGAYISQNINYDNLPDTLEPMTNEELRSRLTDPDYQYRSFKRSRANLESALNQVNVNPSNMGIAGHKAPQMVAPTGVAAPSPIAALQVTPNDDAARRAMMVMALRAPEPRASERVDVGSGPSFENVGRSNLGSLMDQANTAAAISGGLDPQLVPAARVDVGPRPSFENVGRSNLGSLMDQANTAAATSGGVATPVVGAAPDQAPTGGVVTPVMTARPAGVQQPMPFVAGAEPRYMLPTGLGTPTPNSDLAVAASQRPQPRPTDLGTPAVAEPELGAGIIVGNRMTAAPEGIGYDKDRLAAAVRFQESGSPSGNYGVLGAPVERAGGRTDRAYGAYQIMGDNIPQWTKEVLGYSMTPEEFLRDPQAQDAVAKAKLDQMYSQYGNIEDVASVWFSGRPLNNNNSVDKTSGKTVPSYVSDVMNKYYNGGEGSAANYNLGSVNEGVPSFGQGLGGADMTQQRDGVFANDKPYDQRNFLGKFFRNQDGSMNQNALLSVLIGLGKGAEAQTISPLGGILSGIGGGAEAYKGLVKQAADVEATNLANVQNAMKNYSYAVYNGMTDMSWPEYAAQQGIDLTALRGVPTLMGQPPVDPITTADTRSVVTRNIKGVDYQIPFMQDLQSLNDLINKNVGAQSDPSNPMSQVVQQAIAARDQIMASGSTTDVNGNKVEVPAAIRAQNQVAATVGMQQNRDDFRKQGIDAAAQINTMSNTIGNMEKTLTDYRAGPLASAGSAIGALIQFTGANMDAMPDFIKNPEKYTVAAKDAALLQRAQLESIPGGAPAASIQFTNTFTPTPDMPPAAVRELLINMKAGNEYLRQYYEGFPEWAKKNPDRETDIQAYQEEFSMGRDQRYKDIVEGLAAKTPHFKGDVPPGVDTTYFNSKSLRDQQVIWGMYDRGELTGRGN